MELIKKVEIFIVSVLMAFSVTACKPSYEDPTDEPMMTTMSADTPYDMDFVQLNNDVLDALSRKIDIFPFIKAIEVNGSNEDKTIEVLIDIQQGVSDDAVQVLLSEVTKKIADNAYTQDFRLTKADDTQFGSVFDIYSYTYKVTCGDQTLYDEMIPAGGKIPLDPSVDGDTIKEAVESLGK